jgi:transmembrane sensor
MQKEEIEDLIKRYHEGACNTEEVALLETWYAEWNQDKPLNISDELLLDDLKANRDHVLSRTITRTGTIKLWPRIAIAAAAVAAIVFGIWYFSVPPQQGRISEPTLATDIVPGKNTATITLSNGKTITLSDAKTGVVIKGNALSYSDGSAIATQELKGTEAGGTSSTFRVSTPRGGTYQITLSDGSKVWLNAASSLTYSPNLNEHGERSVNLDGEGYFEVAKDSQHPFIVKTDHQEVEVLGTHFNISSYADDETEKTTLLEGKVKLTASGVSRILKPGEQSSLQNGKFRIAATDTDLAVAWKNNEFTFESETIENVMKMVERWYNVEVVYVGDKTTERFSGGVSRFDKISKVLEIIESTGAAHLKIKERKIYVSK